MNPINLIAGLSAVKTLHPSNNFRVTIAVEWPGSKEITTEILKIIKVLATGFPVINQVIAVYPETYKQISNNSPYYSEIYYSHDLMDTYVRTAYLANPCASLICFGDSMGMVTEKKVYFKYLKQNRLNLYLSKLFHFQNRLNHLLSKTPIPKTLPYPQKAVLILPIDQSASYLSKVPLTICNYKIVLEVIEQCVKASIPFNRYIHNLLCTYKSKSKYLLLTENFTETGLINRDGEIKMYCDMIRNFCSQGSVVFIKSHPGEEILKVEEMRKQLQNFVDIISIDKAFKRYPIEIAKELVQNSSIISTAFPALSLKYIYNLDVIQLLNEGFIEEWFPKQSWPHLKNSIDIYMKPLAKLPSWDKNSILWQANN